MTHFRNTPSQYTLVSNQNIPSHRRRHDKAHCFNCYMLYDCCMVNIHGDDNNNTGDDNVIKMFSRRKIGIIFDLTSNIRTNKRVIHKQQRPSLVVEILEER